MSSVPLLIAQQLRAIRAQEDQRGSLIANALGTGIAQGQAARAQRLQQERIQAEQRIAERKATLDAQKAEADALETQRKARIKESEAFQQRGRNTVAAFNSVADELSSSSARKRFQALGRLKEMQKSGIILDNEPIDIADSLTTDPKALSKRFRDRASALDEQFREDFTFEQQKELRRAGKPETTVNVDTGKEDLTKATRTKVQGEFRDTNSLVGRLESLESRMDPRFFAAGGVIRDWASQGIQQLASIPGFEGLSNEAAQRFLSTRTDWLTDSRNLLIEAQALIKGIPSDRDQKLIEDALRGFREGTATQSEIRAALRATLRAAKAKRLRAAEDLTEGLDTGKVLETAAKVVESGGETPADPQTGIRGSIDDDVSAIDAEIERVRQQLRDRGVEVP